MFGRTVKNENFAKDSRNLFDDLDGDVSEVDICPEGWAAIIEDFRMDCTLTGSLQQVDDNLRNVGRYLVYATPQHEAPAGPEDISSDSISRFLTHLQADGRSLKTLHNVRGSLSRFCNFLKLSPNPAAAVKLRTPDEVAPPPLEPEELQEIMKAARLAGIFPEVCVAIYTGLRRGEIARLAWTDVDFERAAITVRKSKAKRVRVVPMALPLARCLRQHQKETGHTPWIFPARHSFRGGWKYTQRPLHPEALGKRIRPLQNQFAKFKMMTGVGRGFHLFRHAFASALVNENVSIYKVADWLGHSDIRMTKRYARLARRYDPEIEKVLSQTAPPEAGELGLTK